MYVPFEERDQMDNNLKRGVYFAPCICCVYMNTKIPTLRV